MTHTSKALFDDAMASALVVNLLPGSVYDRLAPDENDGTTSLTFFDHKQRLWWFSWEEELRLAQATLQLPEEQCGSDDESDWALERGRPLVQALVALLLDIREEKV